jgi:hypothetical protein
VRFGIRKISLKKRVSARLSVKRYVRHSLGLKAPRGLGWLTNPKKALYNRIYNRTSVSVDRLIGVPKSRRGSQLSLFAVLAGAIHLFFSALNRSQDTKPESIPSEVAARADANKKDTSNSE